LTNYCGERENKCPWAKC